MKLFIILSAIIALNCVFAIEDDTHTIHPKTTVTPPAPIKPNTTSTLPPTSTTTVTPPTTSTQKPTTSSPKPTTSPPTTHPPPPTTHAPPPTTPTTSPTTPTPSPTTPTPSPTTPIPPKPAPAKTEVWSLNGTGNTCVIVQMALEIKLNYTNNLNKTESIMIPAPTQNDSQVFGQCGEDEQTIQIEWGQEKMMHQMEMVFVKNQTKQNFKLANITLMINNGAVPNPPKTPLTLTHTEKLFEVPLLQSYRCSKEQLVNLTTSPATNSTMAVLTISHLQVQAFHTEKNMIFGSAEDCPSSGNESSDLVPILVSVFLILLIVGIVGAYLYARHRSPQRQYMSISAKTS